MVLVPLGDSFTHYVALLNIHTIKKNYEKCCHSLYSALLMVCGMSMSLSYQVFIIYLNYCCSYYLPSGLTTFPNFYPTAYQHVIL